jgi:hypothetical protein
MPVGAWSTDVEAPTLGVNSSTGEWDRGRAAPRRRVCEHLPMTGRTSLLTALLCCTAIAVPGIAGADEPTESRAGGELVYGNFDVPILGGGTLIGLDVHADYLLAPGFTVGGHIPIAHADFLNDTGTSLGNLTADLAYSTSRRYHSRGWIEGALSIATADNDGDGGAAATQFGIFWLPDQGRYLPNTTTVQGSYHHAFGTREQMLELSAGVQFLSIDNDDDRLIIPLVIGGRVALGTRAAGVASLSNMWHADASDNEEELFHVLQAGIELSQLGAGRGHILLYLPLDDSYRNDLDVWGLIVGFDATLR